VIVQSRAAHLDILTNMKLRYFAMLFPIVTISAASLVAWSIGVDIGVAALAGAGLGLVNAATTYLLYKSGNTGMEW
jgi:hypothetical protein